MTGLDRPGAPGVIREASPDPILEQAAFAESRRSGLGGSDIAVLLGLSPFKSPLQLYLEKRGEIADEDLSGNEAVTLGNELEPVILQRYAIRHRVEVVRLNGVVYRDKANPWRFVHPDGYVAGTRVGLEAKTAGLVSGRASDEWGDGPDDYPVAYGAQVHWGHTFELFDETVLAAFVAGFGYLEKPIARDRELEEGLIAQAGAFWADVLAGNPPPVRSIDDARALYPRSVPKATIEASDAILAADAELRILEARAKEIEASIDAQKAAIMAFMAENEVLVRNGKAIRSWKLQQSARVDVTRLREQNPELARIYTTLSDSRVFRSHKI
jgi:putative phage-type endonuclease